MTFSIQHMQSINHTVTQQLLPGLLTCFSKTEWKKMKGGVKMGRAEQREKHPGEREVVRPGGEAEQSGEGRRHRWDGEVDVFHQTQTQSHRTTLSFLRWLGKNKTNEGAFTTSQTEPFFFLVKLFELNLCEPKKTRHFTATWVSRL